MTFSVSVLDSLAELPGALRERLDAAASGQRYDQTLPWLEAFVQHFVAPPAKLQLAVLFKDGVPVACLPMMTGAGAAPRFLTSLANYYSFNAGPHWLSADVDRAAAGGALIAALTAAPFRPPGFDLAPIDTACAFWSGAAADFRRGGYYGEPYFRFVNWWLDLAGRNYATYEAELPGNVRNTVQRKRKKLEKSGAVVIRTVRDPAEVDAAMDQYEHVYARSWQRHEAHPAFIRDVARRFAERGWLRLGVLTRDGVPLAAQLWFSAGRTVAIFKLVFDEQFADLSPGSVLTTHLMREVIDDDGARVIDFLSGDDGYKRQWMNRRSEMWGLRAVRAASVAGLVARSRGAAKKALGALRGGAAPKPSTPPG